MTERLARWCSRRPWLTIGAWVVAIVAGLALAIAFLPGNLTTNALPGRPELGRRADSRPL
jgi:hypothetical protein